MEACLKRTKTFLAHQEVQRLALVQTCVKHMVLKAKPTAAVVSQFSVPIPPLITAFSVSGVEKISSEGAVGSKIATCILRALQHRCTEQHRNAFIAFASPFWNVASLYGPLIWFLISGYKRMSRSASSVSLPTRYIGGPHQPDYTARPKNWSHWNTADKVLPSFFVIKLYSAFPTPRYRQYLFATPCHRPTYQFQLANIRCSRSNVLHNFQSRAAQSGMFPVDLVTTPTHPAFKLRLSHFDFRTISALKY